jgi:hypothetical protein
MQGDRLRGRRGNALVLVSLFGLTTLSITGVLLSLTDSRAKQQFGLHRQKQLNLAVKTALAAALNEVNRNRLNGPYDPGNDGVGALLTDPEDGQPGIRLKASDGTVVARYRTTVDTTSNPGATVITAVAVWPDFATTDPNVRRVAAAEAQLTRGRLPFPANALSLVGDTSAGNGRGLRVVGNPTLEIVDPSAVVPAVNATDPRTYSDFVSFVAPNADLLAGADPESGGALEGAGTVTNEGAGFLRQETLDLIGAGIDSRVSSLLLSTGTVAITPATLSSGAPLSDGVYRVDGDLLIASGQTLTGSGTLILTESLLVKGHLDWTGTIIVANDDGAFLQVQNGGRLTVDGVVGVQALAGLAGVGLDLESGSRTDITGALCVLAGGSSNESAFDSGSEVNVDGIVTFLGTDIEVAMEGGSDFHVNGSVAFVVPTGAAKGLDSVEFRGGTRTSMGFDQPLFYRGVDEVGAFFDPDGNLLPLAYSGYWERSALAVLAAQEAQLADASIPDAMP